MANWIKSAADITTGIPIIGPAIGGILKAVDDNTPKLEDEVTVEVVGQPGATKQSLYYLALTTAYGLARPNFLAGVLTAPANLLMMEYDAADNWVRCTVRYRVGAFDFGPTFNPLVNVLLLQDIALIDGPKETIVGQVPLFPFVTFNLPFFGLPFAGKTVLTTSGMTADPNPALVAPTIIPSPNPKPTGDNRSRGSASNSSLDVVSNFLIPMVFAALSDPGSQSLETFSAPTPGPLGV